MHTGERSAAAPPLRWVMWITPSFLLFVATFRRVTCGTTAGDLARELPAIAVLAATSFSAYGPLVGSAGRLAPCAAFALAVALHVVRESRGRHIPAQLRGPAMREPA